MEKNFKPSFEKARYARLGVKRTPARKRAVKTLGRGGRALELKDHLEVRFVIADIV